MTEATSKPIVLGPITAQTIVAMASWYFQVPSVEIVRRCLDRADRRNEQRARVVTMTVCAELGLAESAAAAFGVTRKAIWSGARTVKASTSLALHFHMLLAAAQGGSMVPTERIPEPVKLPRSTMVRRAARAAKKGEPTPKAWLRCHSFEVALSTAEHQALERAALAAGLHRAQYLRKLLHTACPGLARQVATESFR